MSLFDGVEIVGGSAFILSSATGCLYLEHLLWVPPLHRAQGDSLGPVEMLNAKALWKIQNLKSIDFKLKSQ